MTGQSRNDRSAEKKRELLDAAERVYYRNGDLGLTVRRLAAEAATTSQTIYTYFGSRDAVVDGMYERALADLDLMLTSADPAAGGADTAPKRSFVDVAHAYREYCLRRPAHFQMLLMARGPEGTDSDRMRDLRDRLVTIVGNALRNAGGDGISEEQVRVMVSVINGFVQAELNGLFDDADAAEKYADMISIAEDTARGLYSLVPVES